MDHVLKNLSKNKLPIALLVFVLCQPFIDIITSFQVENGQSLTAGTIIRSLFMVLCFGYTTLGVKKHMRKNFPDDGWTTEWVKCNGKEIHFNLHKCIYWELTKMHDCPELCCVYCENDNISFSGLLPQIRFDIVKIS